MAVTKRMRFAVLERDGFRCRYCKRTDLPLEADHVIPKSLGGLDIMGNLVAACVDCNRGKAANPAQLDHGPVVETMRALRPIKRAQLAESIPTVIWPEKAFAEPKSQKPQGVQKYIRDIGGCMGGGMTLQAAARHLINKTGDKDGVRQACEILLERQIA